MEKDHDPRPFILVTPVGGITKELCQTVGSEIATFFGFQARVKRLINEIDFAFNQERNQYLSTIILKALAEQIPRGCLKILAITDQDLFIPILTHVYGEAQLNGQAAIVSTFRLTNRAPASPHGKNIRNRLTKEAIHELGHTFNLRHCQDQTCIMHYCRSLKDVDRKSNHYCRYCSILLADEIKLRL